MKNFSVLFLFLFTGCAMEFHSVPVTIVCAETGSEEINIAYEKYFSLRVFEGNERMAFKDADSEFRVTKNNPPFATKQTVTDFRYKYDEHGEIVIGDQGQTDSKEQVKGTEMIKGIIIGILSVMFGRVVP